MNDSTYSNTPMPPFSLDDLERIKKKLDEQFPPLEQLKAILIDHYNAPEKGSAEKKQGTDGIYLIMSKETFDDVKKTVIIRESPTLISTMSGVPVYDNQVLVFEVRMYGHILSEEERMNSLWMRKNPFLKNNYFSSGV